MCLCLWSVKNNPADVTGQRANDNTGETMFNCGCGSSEDCCRTLLHYGKCSVQLFYDDEHKLETKSWCTLLNIEQWRLSAAPEAPALEQGTTIIQTRLWLYPVAPGCLCNHLCTVSAPALNIKQDDTDSFHVHTNLNYTLDEQSDKSQSRAT